MKPEDQTPYVLSARARREHWLPPKGISALPKSIRNKVPEDLKYWESSGEEAYEKRNKLIKFFEEKKLEFIQDIKTYDPQHMTNQQLMDDARVAIAWYASYLDPNKNIKYSKEDIINVAVKIYKEIARRIKKGDMAYEVSDEKSEAYEKLWNAVKKHLSDSEIDALKERKVEESTTDFIIQHRWYRGPKIVRGGPSYEEFDMKIGNMQFRLDKDPLKETSMSAKEEDQVLRPQFWKPQEKPIELKPNTPENEKPNTPAFLVTHTSGTVDILEDKSMFKKFDFKSGLSGIWIMKRTSPQGVWDFERSKSQEQEMKITLSKPFVESYKETKEGLEVPGVAISPGVWNGLYFSPEVVLDRPERILNIPVCVEHNLNRKVGKPKSVSVDGENVNVTSLITTPEGIKFAKEEAKGYSIDAVLKIDPVRRIIEEIKEYVELTLTASPACSVCKIEKPKEAT